MAARSSEQAESWEATSVAPALESAQVHLWRLPLLADPERVLELARLLSPEEEARRQRFLSIRDQERFLLARASLRRVLAKYVALAPEALRFRYGAHGKPRLEEADGRIHSGPDPVCFNLTHSGDLAVCAVSRNVELGVDIEVPRPLPNAQDLAKRFFTSRESATLEGLGSEERLQEFLRLWTCKEAYLKAIGKGLAKPLHQVEVSLGDWGCERFTDMAGDDEELARWRLTTFSPGDGISGAVVTDGRDVTLRFLELEDR